MNLKQRRIEKHLTQEQIAQQTKLSRVSYCNIENGKRRPSVEVAKKIAEVLDFDWIKFFE